MVDTKKRSIPVVADKKEEKCSCGCGCDCKCGCNGCRKTLLKCGTMLVSALIIAAAITFKPCPGPKAHMPKARQDDAAIREFILKNPKLLVESVEKYYKAEETKAAKAAPKAAPKAFNINDLKLADAALLKQIINDKTNYSLGNKDGKFVIIEFFDYQCGWCKKTNKGLEEAIASKEGKNIRWIPIDTPIFGDASELIARYVLAAGEQGKYAEMHAAVGAATGKVDEAALLEMAKTLKLDTKKLTKDANGDKIKGKLESNNEFRKKLNINGVPMVIVDGHINPGALIGDNLAAVVKLSGQKK